MVSSVRQLTMRISAGGVGLVAALILGACGTGPQASTIAAVSTSARPTESPQGMASVGTASPTPRPATPQPTQPFAIGRGQLAPGRYLQGGFAPGVQFVLGPGWQGYFDDYDGAYLGGPDGLEIAPIIGIGAVGFALVLALHARYGSRVFGRAVTSA